MLKIKLSIPNAKKNINISQFVGNYNNEHNGCKFYVNSEINDPDFWFLMEGPNEFDKICNIDKSRIILLTSEVAHKPSHFDNKNANLFLNQFGEIYTCYEIYRSNVISDLPFLPWMINSNHGHSIFEENIRDLKYFENLVNLDKSKLLSVICSNVKWTDYHIKRISFVTELKKHFKDKLDWFGNGINPIASKWEGIASYKYHIVLENQVKNNVITEKLYDSYLGLSFPIYSGAPNVFDHFGENSLVKINLNDLKGSIRTIEQTISEGFFDIYYQNIRDAKSLVLNEKNLFTRISIIAKEKHNLIPISRSEMKISPLSNYCIGMQIDCVKNLTNVLFRKMTR